MTAMTVQNINTLGYTYPELQNSNGSASIIAAVNLLYGSGTSASSSISSKTKREADPAADAEAAPQPEAPTSSPSSLPLPVSAIATPAGKRYEYITNIVAERFGLDGSFNIYVFLGDFNSDPTQWPFEANLVGIHGMFAASDMRGMMGGLQVTGTVPLTTALLAKLSEGCLPSLDQTDVIPYLQLNLHWRIATVRELTRFIFSLFFLFSPQEKPTTTDTICL